jgi:hypothetical protein
LNKNLQDIDVYSLFAFNITFDMTFGYCIAAANVVGMPVEERENKLK